MKVGTLTLSAATREAIKLCFEYSILSMFSLKGKTKKRFVDLQLFAVIYGKADYNLLKWFLTSIILPTKNCIFRIIVWVTDHTG